MTAQTGLKSRSWQQSAGPAECSKPLQAFASRSRWQPHAAAPSIPVTTLISRNLPERICAIEMPKAIKRRPLHRIAGGVACVPVAPGSRGSSRRSASNADTRLLLRRLAHGRKADERTAHRRIFSITSCGRIAATIPVGCAHRGSRCVRDLMGKARPGRVCKTHGSSCRFLSELCGPRFAQFQARPDRFSATPRECLRGNPQPATAARDGGSPARDFRL